MSRVKHSASVGMTTAGEINRSQREGEPLVGPSLALMWNAALEPPQKSLRVVQGTTFAPAPCTDDHPVGNAPGGCRLEVFGKQLGRHGSSGEQRVRRSGIEVAKIGRALGNRDIRGRSGQSRPWFAQASRVEQIGHVVSQDGP